MALSLVLAGAALPLQALAHDPFDCSSELVVHEDRIELGITVGKDGARRILAGAGLSADAVAQALKMRAPDATYPLSPTVAASFFKITSGENPLNASSANVLCDGVEAIVSLVYPKPDSGTLQLEAQYFGIAPEMRDGSIFFRSPDGQSLGGARLSRGIPTAQFTPSAQETPVGDSSIAQTATPEPERLLSPSLSSIPNGGEGGRRPGEVALRSSGIQSANQDLEKSLPATQPVTEARSSAPKSRGMMWAGTLAFSLLALWLAVKSTRFRRVDPERKIAE